MAAAAVSASRSSPGGATATRGSSTGTEALQQSGSGSGTLPTDATGEVPAGRPRRRRPPGAKWDGKLSSLSLQEYRELKWTKEAGEKSLMRRGPSYTCRTLPRPTRIKSDVLLAPNPMEAKNKLYTTSPSYSMGMSSLHEPPSAAKSPGPIYALKSTMDPTQHVTHLKHTGTRFGSSSLLASDPGGVAPAPGQYNPDAWVYSSMHRTFPNYKVQGRESWKESSLKMPGPEQGEYNAGDCYRTGPANSIRWTIPHGLDPLAEPRGERRFDLPGPPHYNPPGAGARNEHVASTKPKPSAWVFGHDERGLL